jgi:outer membrane protein OmpA-like peptidoglycan-associated protein
MVWFVAQVALASDVDLFDLSGSYAAGEGTLQGESTLLGEAGFSGGLSASYAKDPVVRLFADETVSPAVDSQIPFTLSGGWTFGDVARATVFVPVYPWVSAPITDFAAGGLGDVVVQAAFPVWTSAEGDLSVGLVPRLGLPTGTSDALVAAGTTAELVATVTGRVGDVGLVWNGNVLGAANSPLEVPGPGLGSRLGTLAGVFWQASDALRVGGELDFDVGVARGTERTDGAPVYNNTGAAHAFVQSILPTGVGLGAGIGTGTLRGVGSPAWRAFGSFTYTAIDRDPDSDGILGKADTCPTEPEDVDRFEDTDGCPDDDNDRDGVVDGTDLCPDDAEDVDNWDDADGCPEIDNDFDKVLDAADACPIEAGSIEAKGCPDRDRDAIVDAQDTCPDLPGSAEFAGCPDRDGDKIPEPRDLCPDVPVPPGTDLATSDGCPPQVVAVQPAPSASVYRKGSEIKILDRIEFELGKATLRSVSFPTLDQVAALLVANPDVTEVEVQGHTDNVGSESSNLTLSSARASSVVDYLVAKGVAPSRLTPKGFGESDPMFSNRTQLGRDQNRRVQFLILEASTGDTLIKTITPAPVPVVPVAPMVPTVVVPPAPKVVSGSTGTLDIVLPDDVWGTVALDGELLSKAAPFSGYSLSAGEHTIRVQNSRLKLDWTKTFTVEPGKPVRLEPMGAAAPAPAPAEEDNPWKLDDDLDLENPWTTPSPAPAPPPAPAPEPAPEPKKRKDLKR